MRSPALFACFESPLDGLDDRAPGQFLVGWHLTGWVEGPEIGACDEIDAGGA